MSKLTIRIERKLGERRTAQCVAVKIVDSELDDHHDRYKTGEIVAMTDTLAHHLVKHGIGIVVTDKEMYRYQVDQYIASILRKHGVDTFDQIMFPNRMIL